MSADLSGLRLQQLAVGALSDVSLVIRPAQIVCLSGASGSGKSRLLRAIADLEPHQGQVWLHGLAHHSMPANRWRAQVMLVPAESQWWHDRVGEHLPEPDKPALEELGFDESVLGWSVARLSSGEKQRLALLRALARRPQALLLDEPTANLDAENIQRVERFLQDWIARHQTPTLWVAHDPQQIARVADRHLSIQGASLAEVG